MIKCTKKEPKLGSGMVWFDSACITTQVIFIVFKLCHIIAWNWLIVLIPAFVLVAYFLIMFIAIAVGSILVFTAAAVTKDEMGDDD